MTRELEARLKLTGDDRTGKATASAAKGLERVAKQAERTERAMKRAAAANKAMSANVRHQAAEVVRLEKAMKQQQATIARLSYQSAGGDRASKRIAELSRRARLATLAAPVEGLLPFAAGAGATMAVSGSLRTFAETERRLTRIGVTAGATAQQMAKADASMRRIAANVAMPIDQVRDGLDVLTAAGKSLEDGMALLPAVARTAQASGASLEDVASTAASIGSSMKIGAGDMESAFDHLATAGKLGLFELKDMAQYLPSLAPAFAAIGYEGVDGLAKAAAMLQIIRSQTGDASDAATSMANILQKMETDKTVDNFDEFGIDLRKEMAKARREGKDLLKVFLDLADEAVKGDLSKLPQLFGDAEVLRGMRPLLARRAELLAMEKEIARTAAGAVDRDLGVVKANAISSYDNLANAVNKAADAFGRLMGAAGVFDRINETASSIERLADNLDAWRGGAVTGLEDTLDMLAETPAERAYADEYRRLTGRDPSEAHSGQVRTIWSPWLRGTTSEADVARGREAAARDVAAEGGGPPTKAASHAAATTDAVIQAQNAVWGAQDMVAGATTKGERRYAMEMLALAEKELAQARERERQAKAAAGAAAARDISGVEGGKEIAREVVDELRAKREKEWAAGSAGDPATEAAVVRDQIRAEREKLRTASEGDRAQVKARIEALEGRLAGLANGSATGDPAFDALSPVALKLGFGVREIVSRPGDFAAAPPPARPIVAPPAFLDDRGDFYLPRRRGESSRAPGQLEGAALPRRRPKPSAAPADYTLGSTGSFQAEGDIEAIGEAADDAADKLGRLPEAMNPAAFGAAAQASGTAFRDGLIAEIDRTVTTAKERIAELKNMMSFTATPTVNVRVNGRPGPAPVQADRGPAEPELGGLGVP